MAQKREKEETELKVTEPLIRTSPIPTPPNLSGTDDSDPTVDRSTSIILSSHPSDGSDNRSAQRSDPPLDDTNLTVDSSSFRVDEARSKSSERKRRRFLQPASASAYGTSESDRFSSVAMVEMKRRDVNRCAGCRRKVGLTGFRCRCGEMFCPEHRYSDRHDCSFDYKAAGKEMIARENPVVRAAKILKV